MVVAVSLRFTLCTDASVQTLKLPKRLVVLWAGFWVFWGFSISKLNRFKTQIPEGTNEKTPVAVFRAAAQDPDRHCGLKCRACRRSFLHPA